ncbi:flagellar hook-associated protein FlgL [bacterium]|nr:flagellar hook-associated protein FlgL [bacterium]
MRITNKMISNRLLATLSANRAMAADLQLDLATGKSIRKPSDDPSGMHQLNRFKVLISQNEQYSRNITQIRGFVSAEQGAVDSIIGYLERAKETAIQAASDTVNDEGRQSLAKNLDQTIGALVTLANSKFNNRYIFGGTLTKTPPFSRSGDVVTYGGNEKTIVGQIGIETQIQYGKTGTQVFNPSSGTDIFGVLTALKQALETNDTNAIQASIDLLSDAISQTVDVAADVGLLADRLNLTEELIESQNIRHAEAISKIQDADIAETIVNFTNLENAITTGTQALAETIQTSLIDFIG